MRNGNRGQGGGMGRGQGMGMQGGQGAGLGQGLGRGRGGMCRRGLGPNAQPTQPEETGPEGATEGTENDGDVSAAPFGPGFGPRRYRLRDGSCLRGAGPRGAGAGSGS